MKISLLPFLRLCPKTPAPNKTPPPPANKYPPPRRCSLVLFANELGAVRGLALLSSKQPALAVPLVPVGSCRRRGGGDLGLGAGWVQGSKQTCRGRLCLAWEGTPQPPPSLVWCSLVLFSRFSKRTVRAWLSRAWDRCTQSMMQRNGAVALSGCWTRTQNRSQPQCTPIDCTCTHWCQQTDGDGDFF